MPQYDVRVADVAFVSAERWANVDLEDNVRGAPELVIGVLSPSNAAREMYEKEQLRMAHGCWWFWVTDPDKRYVRVALANGPTTSYRPGEHIPLKLLGDTSLFVDDLFPPS